jgi:hypothetical protein
MERNIAFTAKWYHKRMRFGKKKGGQAVLARQQAMGYVGGDRACTEKIPRTIIVPSVDEARAQLVDKWRQLRHEAIRLGISQQALEAADDLGFGERDLLQKIALLEDFLRARGGPLDSKDISG